MRPNGVADMPAIPDPPSPTSASEVPEHAQLAWLHELALYLDPALSLPELAQSGRTMSEFQGRTAADTSAGSVDGDGPALSASACFQALLVHATPAAAKASILWAQTVRRQQMPDYLPVSLECSSPLWGRMSCYTQLWNHVQSHQHVH